MKQATTKYADFSREDLVKEIIKLNSSLATLQHFMFYTGKETSVAKGENLNPDQPGLFNEAEYFALEDDETEEEPEKDQSESESKPKPRRRGKRQPIPAYFPREEEVIDITPEQKVCPRHGTPLDKIGESSVEKVKLIPAKIVVINRKTPKYKCCACEHEDDKTEIISAPTPPDIIPKSFATPELLAHVVTSKYEDHLPLYRQEKMFMRIGINLTRATMARWMINCATEATPLINLIDENALSEPVLHIDETLVQALKEEARTAQQKSYMWVYGTPENKPFVRFRYYPTRAKEAAIEILGDYRGVAVCDAYKSYDAAARNRDFILAACWAHVRRKFFLAEKEAKKAKVPGRKILASAAMAFIRRLYTIEREIKDESVQARLTARLEKSQQILGDFHAWLNEQSIKVLPKSSLGKAISYALGIWDKLKVFTTDTRVSIDNNWIESRIRNFVIGRNNWVFCDTAKGAEASATLFTLIESAKLNGLNPNDYLCVIFKELPRAKTLGDYEKLLPYNINKHHDIAPYLSPPRKAASTT